MGATNVNSNSPFRRGNNNIVPKQLGLSFQTYDSGLPFNGGENIANSYFEQTNAAISSLLINDPNFAGNLGAMAFANTIQTDTAATFVAADTIDVTGIDLSALTPPVAVAGVTSNFFSASILWIKQSDVAADEKGYIISGLANGSTTNSRAILADAVTGAPAVITGTTFTIYIANQAGVFGAARSGAGTGPSSAIVGMPGTGDSSQPLFASFSDSGDYSNMFLGFNVGDLGESMMTLNNFGPLVGANADVPYLAFGASGSFVPDNADIWFLPRAADPTLSVTLGPAITISFTNGGGGNHTITDSGSGFIAAGFRKNTTCTVSGAANPSNNGSKRIVGVTAGTLTIDSSETIVNEGAGASVTIVDTLLQQGAFWWNATANSFKYVDNVGTITSLSAGASDLQGAYNGGQEISTTSGAVQIVSSFGGNLTYGAGGTPFTLINDSSRFYSLDIWADVSAPPPKIWATKVGAIEQVSVTFPAPAAPIGPVGTISFTAPDTMADSGSGLGGLSVGDVIAISGGTGNDGDWIVLTSGAASVTLSDMSGGATISTAAPVGAAVVTPYANKIEFGAGINLAGSNVSLVGVTSDITTNLGFIKATDISPTDEQAFQIVTFQNGAGTNSVASVIDISGSSNPPTFTATTGTVTVANQTFQQFVDGSQVWYSPPSRSAVNGASFNWFNQGGSGSVCGIANRSTAALTDAVLRLDNINSSATADVPMLKFVNQADSADIRLTGNTADPTIIGEGDLWYNTTTDRLRLRVTASTETLAYQSDVTSFYDATVAQSGGDYTTVGAAWTAGARKILVTTGGTDTVTETGNININSDMTVTIEPSVNWDFGDFRVVIGASTLIQLNGGGTITYAHTAGLPLFDEGAGNSKIIARDLTVDNNSTIANTYFIDSTATQVVEDIEIQLPNTSGGGLNFTLEDCTVDGLTLVGGGATSQGGLIMSAGHASKITLEGQFQVNADAIDMTAAAVLRGVIGNHTTNDTRITVFGNASDIIIKGSQNLDVTVGGDETVLRGGDIGPGGILTMSGADDCKISDLEIGSFTDDASSFRNMYTNINCAGVITFNGPFNQWSNFRCVGSVTISTSADNTRVSNYVIGPVGGGTTNKFIVSAGATAITLIGGVVDDPAGSTLQGDTVLVGETTY